MTDCVEEQEMTTETDLLSSSVSAFTEALWGDSGSLNAWLEVNDESEVAAHIEAYASACVYSATAEKDAEIDALRTRLEDTVRDSNNKIEALRAEVERLNRILGRIVEGDGDSTLVIRMGADAFAAAREYLLRDREEGHEISGYTCTVPDDCETLHWRGQILSLNELASVAQPAGDECHCGTCTCNPHMTPAVRFDLSPAQTEGAIREHLIRLGWTPPDEHALSQPAEQRGEIEALRAKRDALLDALRQITEWPDGGSFYGQENIKRFAQHAIDAAMRKEDTSNDGCGLLHPGSRLALELECLLMDTRNDAAKSRWWASAHEALEQWRQAVRAMEALRPLPAKETAMTDTITDTPGYVLVRVETISSALEAIRSVMEDVYHRRVPECCGHASGECCGNFIESWPPGDVATMDGLAPAEKALSGVLANQFTPSTKLHLTQPATEAAMTVEQAARDFFGWFNRHYPAPSTNPDHEWNRLGVALVNHQEEAQPAAHPAITHCDNCGCDWLDNGLNPVGCPYCELRQETERRFEGNRRAAQEYVGDMRDVLREAAQVCKDLDDEALAKESRLACGAECAAAIADLAVRMKVGFIERRTAMTECYEKNHRVAAKVVSWARPVYATEPAEGWDAGDLVDVEFYNRPEKPEGEGWRPLVFAEMDNLPGENAKEPGITAMADQVRGKPAVQAEEG